MVHCRQQDLFVSNSLLSVVGITLVTSSVAAVTILPSATELARAWKAWQNASKKLSRLRFIRRRIRELGHVPHGQKILYVQPDKSKRTRHPPRMDRSSDVFASARRRDYTAEVLGAGANDDTNDDFWASLNLGPEQIAVYSLEMAKVSAPSGSGFCPE